MTRAFLLIMEQPSHLLGEDLNRIRQTVNIDHLFSALSIREDVHTRGKTNGRWGYSPFQPNERTASFHMQPDGRWYCHSTGQGGGVIELVQRLFNLSCYNSGRWLLDHGVCTVVERVRQKLEDTDANSQEPERSTGNRPIQIDLSPYLRQDHPEFRRRGIPADVLAELGAGYLERPPRTDGKPDPLNQRLAFQVRGIVEPESGPVEPVILSHVGRATTAEQEQEWGKWFCYSGFRKSLELYNLDHILLDARAAAQIDETGHVLVVEGCFDVAKLYAAGIRNVVATFGAHLSATQLQRLDLISELHGVDHFLFFYDRDLAGRSGMLKARKVFTGAFRTLRELGYPAWVADLVDGLSAHTFDWEQLFSSPQRGQVAIPEAIADPCDLSVEQLRWLRSQALI